MSDPLAAYEAPPRVTHIDGEIVMIGEGVCAAYTPEAATLLAQQLLKAVQRQRQANCQLH